jgi:alpha-glucuronidase
VWCGTAKAEDGSQLWLRYRPLPETLRINYSNQLNNVVFNSTSSTRKIALDELKKAFSGLTNKELSLQKKLLTKSIVIGSTNEPLIKQLVDADQLKQCEKEGFIVQSIIRDNLPIVVIAANNDNGLLYGVFEFIRQLQNGVSITGINLVQKPSYDVRVLNHWDNLDGSVERGYAGHSLWKWDELPNVISPRYEQYARANASVGINGVVLNNVNATPEVLSNSHLVKVKVLADIFRPYGIKTYLAVNFSSPKELGGLPTSDPLNPQVVQWWKDKAKELYALIPDFGGFLVKANSEGLPGPQDFGRTHADGANMLADALRPYNGIVMWRAFVYKSDGADRAKQAYNEFLPLDGKFRSNVIIQVKNGPIDFQPREPFSPIFGAMKHTSLMPEFQITQEYLGFSTHMVFLAPLFEECLDTDTYAEGRHTTIARITDGSVFNDSITAMAGVANIGEDTNWCGHHFAQANWYAFGRLAWDNSLSSKTIANEWIRQTFTNDAEFVREVSAMMMQSREAAVKYMTPLGLHHLMGWDHHYGPEPWCNVPGARADWMPSFYHKADSFGIGFNRSSTGSKATIQYAEPLRSVYDNPSTCPEIYLLWFHHLAWDYVLPNGNELWDELCYKYSTGVNRVKTFQKQWDGQMGKIDNERFDNIGKKLQAQAYEAMWWRDACLLYFQTFSKKPIPFELERPIHDLQELKLRKFNLKHHN